MNKARRLWVALGANQGNCLDSIAQAIVLILDAWKPTHYEVSSVYLSRPWGYFDQADFFNAIMYLEVFCSPQEALTVLMDIEKKLGRERGIKNGPRVIDLDIILLGQESLNSLHLCLPHPRFLSRSFVVWPMLSLSPDVVLPDGRLVRHAAEAFDEAHITKLPIVWDPSHLNWHQLLPFSSSS
jgi:2-amino-4-hydroxy-6-hydroxymethyldihydropteridine diphosphokinase